MNAIQSTLYGPHLSQTPSKHNAQPNHPPDTLGQAIDLIETMQDELNELRSKLSHAEQLSALGALTAGLAHEFNNILTPIGSYAQLALSQPDNQALAEKALDVAVKGSAKASQLVESTLALVSNDKEQPNHAIEHRCESISAIQESLDILKPMLSSQGIETQADIESADLAIDGLAVQQIVTNLINNASKAMQGKTGKKQILITGRRRAGRFTFSVEDTGPGIPKAILKQVFEPFVSDSESSTVAACPHEQRGGTGLGMSICKQLIETAGGSISAGESQLGGAQIQLDLQLA